MPSPWEKDPVLSSGPWERDSVDSSPSSIGIRAATPWESIKSRAQEFLHDPIGTLSRPIPGTEDYQGRGDPYLQFALGGIAPGGDTLREFVALPKSKGLAKVTEFPGQLIQAYRNANRAAGSASALRVAQARQAEHTSSRFSPPPSPTYVDPVPAIPPSPKPKEPRYPEGWSPTIHPDYAPTIQAAEPQYPPPPEPTYIDAPAELPPPAPMAGPRLPEDYTPTVHPDYLPGQETAEQMAARHEAEAAAAVPPTTGGTSNRSLDDIALSLAGKKYAKLDANGQVTVQKIASMGGGTSATPGLTAPKRAAPSSLPSPAIPTTAPAATTTIARPLGGTPIAENEANLVNTLRGNTTRKNLEIGQYFTGKGMTPQQVMSMPEAEFNAHIRNVKNANGNAYQPSTGRNYHRTPEQARADVVNAMRAMQPLPAPTMPKMIAAPQPPAGLFPPPAWPPQPPAQ